MIATDVRSHVTVGKTSKKKTPKNRIDITTILDLACNEDTLNYQQSKRTHLQQTQKREQHFTQSSEQQTHRYSVTVKEHLAYKQQG